MQVRLVITVSAMMKYRVHRQRTLTENIRRRRMQTDTLENRVETNRRTTCIYSSLMTSITFVGGTQPECRPRPIWTDFTSVPNEAIMDT